MYILYYIQVENFDSMNWLGYKFSKESEPELLEFLTVASKQNNQSPLPLELKELWQSFLPIDEDILQKISKITSESKIECIDITSSDDEIDQHSNHTKNAGDLFSSAHSFIQPTETITKLNINTTEDLIDGVKELLETEATLSEDIIKQFGRDFSSQKLQDMFVSFSNELNSECILRLWESISNCACNERNLVATYFSRYILGSKIVNKDVFVKDLLRDMFNKMPGIVTTDIVRVLIETTNTRQLIILRKHLEVLSDDKKKQVLEQFLKSCSSIEERHILSILSLVTKHTDLSVLNNIIEIMYNTAKEFATEKTFGKLITEVLQVLDSNIIKYVPQMKYIIGNHKSVYGSQINKIFYSLLQDHEHMSINNSRI